MKVGDKVRMVAETGGGPAIGHEGVIYEAGINGPEVHYVEFPGFESSWTADGRTDLWACAETQLELIEPDKPE